MTFIPLTTTASLPEIAQRTRNAARQLSQLSTEQRNQALFAIATALESAAPEILAANAADCEAAQAEGISAALSARLKLDSAKLQTAILGVQSVARLADPIGAVQIHRQLDTDLVLKRITCPLGVLGVIFEARPDALIQISALAIKSGNGVLLKGGREALLSCTALAKAIQAGLATSDVSPEVVQLLTTRAETLALLQLEQSIDLIIPRGSNEFVRFIQDNTRIPVLGHAEGICHLYVDASAELSQAVAIAVDAKTQYPAACNAIETLLVHAQIAPTYLPQAAAALLTKGVELRGDAPVQTILQPYGVPLKPVTPEDWATEYSDLILSIRVVPDLETALAHIQQYGSRHTEAIVTENLQSAQTFLAEVDAAGVFHNCSTRFSDGYRYGFGAEVGISTQKMPPRGPVGLEGLVTYKYQLLGKGQIVTSYSGSEAKTLIHQDL